MFGGAFGGGGSSGEVATGEAWRRNLGCCRVEVIVWLAIARAFFPGERAGIAGTGRFYGDLTFVGRIGSSNGRNVNSAVEENGTRPVTWNLKPRDWLNVLGAAVNSSLA